MFSRGRFSRPRLLAGRRRACSLPTLVQSVWDSRRWFSWLALFLALGCAPRTGAKTAGLESCGVVVEGPAQVLSSVCSPLEPSSVRPVVVAADAASVTLLADAAFGSKATKDLRLVQLDRSGRVMRQAPTGLIGVSRAGADLGGRPFFELVSERRSFHVNGVTVVQRPTAMHPPIRIGDGRFASYEVDSETSSGRVVVIDQTGQILASSETFNVYAAPGTTESGLAADPDGTLYLVDVFPAGVERDPVTGRHIAYGVRKLVAGPGGKSLVSVYHTPIPAWRERPGLIWSRSGMLVVHAGGENAWCLRASNQTPVSPARGIARLDAGGRFVAAICDSRGDAPPVTDSAGRIFLPTPNMDPRDSDFLRLTIDELDDDLRIRRTLKIRSSEARTPMDASLDAIAPPGDLIVSGRTLRGSVGSGRLFQFVLRLRL